MNAHELLIAARKLIERPENWTQGALARDAAGKPVNTHEPCAACFCMLGALLRASAEGASTAFHAAFATLLAATGNGPKGSLGAVNDCYSHAEVLTAFDRAIEATGGAA